MLPDKSNIDT